MSLFRKRRAEQDIDEELQAHLDIEVRQLVDRGLSIDEAKARARQSFGNKTSIAERYAISLAVDVARPAFPGSALCG